MRQKYMISRDDTKKQLKIREYAVIERDPKKVVLSMLEKSKFSFLCEETYASDIIIRAISGGVQGLVASLRTHNIFPIAPYAAQIAESVTALYSASEDGSVELFFDDVDLVADRSV
ncbi:MAG: hypothetical protein GY697_18225 [Desulfobacterales bacterium]|nr:hypothetical protein [Desulfobacterales bacterium]